SETASRIATILALLVAAVGPAARATGDAERPRFNPRVADIGATNMVPNSSFEAGASGWSSIGQLTAWGGELTGLVGTIDGSEAYDGSSSLCIDMGPGKTPVTHFVGWPAAEVVQTTPLAGHIG